MWTLNLNGQFNDGNTKLKHFFERITIMEGTLGRLEVLWDPGSITFTVKFSFCETYLLTSFQNNCNTWKATFWMKRSQSMTTLIIIAKPQITNQNHLTTDFKEIISFWNQGKGRIFTRFNSRSISFILECTAASLTIFYWLQFFSDFPPNTQKSFHHFKEFINCLLENSNKT